MIVHLDTHTAIWMFMGDSARFPRRVRQVLAAHRPMISPMVRLELALLHEIGRFPVAPPKLIEKLGHYADLGVAESRFERVAAIAEGLTFTRDPFDRMIVAHAMADDVPLLTKDRTILEACPSIATWD